MKDFVLILQPLPDRHLVRAECQLIGQVTSHTISIQDRQALASLGERLRSSPLREITEVVATGRKLFSYLFGPVISRHLWNAIEEAKDAGGVRILLRFERDDWLQDLPWELLHDGLWPLALNPATPIARFIEMPERILEPRPVRSLRVLLTAANPQGTPPLNLGTEMRMVRDHLRSLKGVDVTVENQLTFKHLENLLTFAEKSRKPFHIWHHAGHGRLDQNDRFQLCLEGSEGKRLADCEALSQILKACPNLLAVVLNVCHGANLAKASAYGNVPVTIGFREQIRDHAALLFAQQFYGNLRRYPVEVALSHSRLALAYQGSPLLNWTNPVLYTRTTKVARFME